MLVDILGYTIILPLLPFYAERLGATPTVVGMLVSAFAGTGTMKRAYAHAIEEGYRFYSYGDASLLWRA